ncbi:hypothetical protein GF312_05885 [Candidatus Poribacteria bacterium]|nr:hypothetical protein [Candidatus Poribacteria bacterium]
MSKLYFNKASISPNHRLLNILISLVEKGIAKIERQHSFRELYDIEILGITIYYRKNWRYDKSNDENSMKEREKIKYNKKRALEAAKI